MRYKLNFSRILFLVADVLVLLIIGFACLAPIWHVIMASISNPTVLGSTGGLVLFPLKEIDVTAYHIILQYKKLWVSYGYTIFYIIASCCLTGVFTVTAGYIFSRKRFRFRNTFMMLISFTMLFNGGMIPTFIMIQKIGLIDTPFALIFPGMLNVFNILIMRTAMEGIPNELEESARIDGAGEFVIIWKIILPLCKASFAVIMLFTAVNKWNDYMSALLYLPSRTDLYPLQMVLRQILITSTADYSNVMAMASSVTVYNKSIEYAAIVVSTIPILCIYPFVQKYFVAGVTLGAVKS